MSRKYKSVAERSKGDTALKVVLMTVIILIMAGTCIYFLADIIMQDKPDEPDPGPADEPEADLPPDNGHENTPGTENGQQPEHDPEPSPGLPAINITVADLSVIYPELSDALAEESLAHNCAGVGMVVYDGYADMFYAFNYGYADKIADRPVNTDTKFRVASLSKLITALCAMILVDEGKLDLDTDISVYLGYEVKNPNYPDVTLTPRMLLQHTSTVLDTQTFHDSASGAAWVPTQDLLGRSSSFWNRKPGTAFEYTNFGYSVLGAIIEYISRIKLDDFAHEYIFEPLDIDASFLPSNLTDKGNIAALYDSGHSVTRSVTTQIENSRTGDLGQDQHLAQGGLMISALDYAKILAMLGNGGVFQERRILSQEAVAEIHNADFANPEYMQGLSTRFTPGANPEDDPAQDDLDRLIWRYLNVDGTQVPSDGFYWHTGSAYGVFAQYIYIAGSGTDKGIGGEDTSRGVVVITTGASTARASNGMVNVCTHLSVIAWQELGFDQR